MTSTKAHDLLARYRQGELEALESLVHLLRRPLFTFIRRRVASQQDAEDIFQDVWLKALRALPRYRRGHFAGWLFRIARNVIIDRARRAHPEWSLQAGRDEEDLQPLEDRLAAPGPTPDRQAAARDLGLKISAAVQTLPAEQREVFLLRMDAGMPFKEIARLQGVSINTALARMQYALDKLRYMLEEEQS